MLLENWLAQRALTSPDRAALIAPGTALTYAELERDASAAARRLAAGGIPDAHRVMRADGRVADGYREGDGRGPEAARARLVAEGLRFGADGRADPARRRVPQPPAGTTR